MKSRQVLAVVAVAVSLLLALVLSLAPWAEAFTLTPIPVYPIYPIADPVQVNFHKTVESVPLYRLSLTTPVSFWHSYTISEHERSQMKDVGYLDDGIVAYVSPVQLPGTEVVRRYAIGNCTALVIQQQQHDSLVQAGYHLTGHVGFMFNDPYPTSVPPGQIMVLRSWRWAKSGQGLHMANGYYGSTLSWAQQPGHEPGYNLFRAWASETTLQEITVHPLDPNELKGGDSVAITWTSRIAGGVVEILYTVDDGANWTPIVKDLPAGAGTHAWTVPNINADKANILVRWSRAPGTNPFAWAAGPAFKISTIIYFPIYTITLQPFLIELQPSAPTGLLANGLGLAPQIQLYWEDNSGVETGFVIERRAGSGPYAIVGTVAANVEEYADTAVAAGVEYTYRVKATGASTDSVYSNEATAVWHGVPPGEVETPVVELAGPSSLTATELASPPRVVSLGWTKSPAAGVSGYMVERKTHGTWELIASLPASAAAYLDGDLSWSAVTQATYRVLAHDGLVQSWPTNEAVVTLGGAPALELDGTQSAWAEGELALAHQHGLTFPAIMNQYGRPITREEFCTIAVKLYEQVSGLVAVPGSDPFEDTDNPEVLKAYALGIVQGISATQFAPYNNITRQEMCVMIYRALAAAGKDVSLPPPSAFTFSDAGSIAPWAINEVRYCNYHGIMRGYTDNTIRPLLNTPREQAIVLVWRTFDEFK